MAGSIACVLIIQSSYLLRISVANATVWFHTAHSVILRNNAELANRHLRTWALNVSAPWNHFNSLRMTSALNVALLSRIVIFVKVRVSVLSASILFSLLEASVNAYWITLKSKDSVSRARVSSQTVTNVQMWMNVKNVKLVTKSKEVNVSRARVLFQTVRNVQMRMNVKNAKLVTKLKEVNAIHVKVSSQTVKNVQVQMNVKNVKLPSK